MIRRIALALLAVLFCTLGAVANAGPAMADTDPPFTCDPANPDPSPCPPDATTTGLHDANFKSIDSSDRVLMCRDWTTAYGDGRNEPGTCKFTSDGGAQKTLGYGESTDGTLHWTDADGFYVPAGKTVVIRLGVAYGWIRYYNTGWRKKTGCNDCRYEIKIIDGT